MAGLNKRIYVGDDKSLARYLHDISALSLITPEDEVTLAKRIKKGDQSALTKLVNANLRFVVSVAKNYQNQGLSLSDLINEGNVGLIEAALRFDETKGYKFISYAVWWIRQGILQALQEHSRLIRLPQNKVGALKKIGRTQSYLEQELEREPTTNEIAEKLEVSSKEIHAIAEIAAHTISLDAPLNSDETNFLVDCVEDPESCTPDSALIEKSFQDELKKALNTLSEREVIILKLYFGIGTDRALTLEEIAQRFHITRERVRQIKERSLTKLRHQSGSKGLRAYLD